MLGKCMKYELKAFARLMLPLIGVFFFSWVILAVYMNFLFRYDGFLWVLMWIIALPMLFVSLIGIPAVACFYAVKRYNDVMFSDKAYLMRALPVKVKVHLICIFLNSILWYFIAMGIIALALVLPSFAGDPSKFASSLSSLIREIITKKDQWMPFFFSAFAMLLNTELTIMLAVTFAAKHNGSRGLLSFGYYLAISFVSSIIQGLVLAVISEVSRNDDFLTGSFGTVSSIYRIAVAAGIFVFLLYYVDKKADVR